MVTQTEFPVTKMTTLDKIKLLIKQKQEARQKVEEKFTDAQNKYDTTIGEMDYELEILRRVQKDYEERDNA